MGDKAQIHTIEGFTAAFLIVFTLLFAIQAIGITPTSSSTASQQVEQQNYKLADDVLSQSKASGELKGSLLYWNNSTSNPRFGEAVEGRGHYSGRLSNTVPDTTEDTEKFNETLQILHKRGLAHNVYLVCDDGTRHEYIYNGQPSQHASTASVTLTLHDQDEVVVNDSDPGTKVSFLNSSGISAQYPCPKMDYSEYPGPNDNSDLYNVVEVRIVIWRM